MAKLLNTAGHTCLPDPEVRKNKSKEPKSLKAGVLGPWLFAKFAVPETMLFFFCYIWSMMS